MQIFPMLFTKSPSFCASSCLAALVALLFAQIPPAPQTPKATKSPGEPPTVNSIPESQAEAIAETTQEGFEPSPRVQAPQNRLGISHSRPSSGPFIQHGDVYLVPYECKIPGTDITFNMVPVPAGDFLFGPQLAGKEKAPQNDSRPLFRTQPFWIGKHEVTWAEFKQFMTLHKQLREFQRQRSRIVTKENAIDAISAPSLLYDPKFVFMGDTDQHPAASMTLFSAKQYTKWLSRLTGDFYRLPTEAEWEYACRAGTSTQYGFGDQTEQLEKHGWLTTNADESRQPVGRLLPNNWGLHDMHGNVAEWVLEGYSGGNVKTPPDVPVDASQTQTPVDLPDHPPITRGGSALSEDPAELRSTARVKCDVESLSEEDPDFPRSPWWHSSYDANFVGFRIVRPLIVPAKLAREKYYRSPPRIEKNAKSRVDQSGRGAYGIVDPKFPSEYQKIKNPNKNQTPTP